MSIIICSLVSIFLPLMECKSSDLIVLTLLWIYIAFQCLNMENESDINLKSALGATFVLIVNLMLTVISVKKNWDWNHITAFYVILLPIAIGLICVSRCFTETSVVKFQVNAQMRTEKKHMKNLKEKLFELGSILLLAITHLGIIFNISSGLYVNLIFFLIFLLNSILFLGEKLYIEKIRGCIALIYYLIWIIDLLCIAAIIAVSCTNLIEHEEIVSNALVWETYFAINWILPFAFCAYDIGKNILGRDQR